MEVRKIPKKAITVIEPKGKMIVDKEKYRQKRVAAYCRVSTDSEEQLTSYTTQKKVYTEMIAANKQWCFAGLYADEGISGTIADKRPEFKKMIKDCLDGKIDYIITKSVSRFARNTVECLEYVRLLKARGIGIFFEEQNIDTLKSDSELYLVIYAGFAQSESESISKNVTWSFRKNFEEGKVSFRYKQMLGYKKGDDGEPEIVPAEAELVEDIFDMYLAGMPIKVISDEMRTRHVTLPNKKVSFNPSTIQSILTNEKYCGDAILQKTVTIDCISKTRRKNTGEAPMYYVSNNHPGIISHDKFNRVQEEMVRRKAKAPQSEKRTFTSQGKYSRYALTDIMICGECGTRYRRCTWSKRGKKKVVWRCINRLDNGTKYCKHSPTIEENLLHQAVVSAINKFNSEDSALYMNLLKATIKDAIGISGGADEIDLLTRRVDSLNQKMMMLVNQSIADGGDIESHENEFLELSNKIKELNDQINAIRKAASENTVSAERMKEIEKHIDEYAVGITEYDDMIMRQIIECIKVHENGDLEIIFGGGYTINETVNNEDAS